MLLFIVIPVFGGLRDGDGHDSNEKSYGPVNSRLGQKIPVINSIAPPSVVMRPDTGISRSSAAVSGFKLAATKRRVIE